MIPTVTIINADCREALRSLPDESVHCCVTSPPYFGLRDYGVEGQIGLEQTPDEYVEAMRAVFAEVRRVLRDDGTLWLNMGDSYAGSGRGGNPENSPHIIQRSNRGSQTVVKFDTRQKTYGLKPKDLLGIPWRVAFALQADGWYLRSDIIWHKPNPMPESITDRPTKSHEYIFLLSKSARYFYDAEAIQEEASEWLTKQMNDGYTGNATKDYAAAGVQDPSETKRRIIENAREKWGRKRGEFGGKSNELEGRESFKAITAMRNKRTVWTVTTKPYSDAHFATYPPDLIKPCILAGCPVGGTVLDPFGGSGTTGMVALELGRRAILVELNPEYVKMIEKRTFVTPGLALTSK